jgi:2-C-methyl-D-erythritol 4-phosphate cytidylyltransferase/2-C-methyl-D-erythritol 2,4-cyclodiphosphate synthase
MRVTAIIAAAGAGRRMGFGQPKQFLELGGLSILQRTLNAFHQTPAITDLIVVTRPDAVADVWRYIDRSPNMIVVEGGATRQASVAAGFAHVPAATDYVIVHDAARPFVTRSLIERTLEGAVESGAAIAAIPTKDTVKEIAAEGERRFIARTIAREGVYLAQTPQAFRRDIFAEAVALGRSGAVATDEAGLAELAGRKVQIVEGDPGNLKITTENDLSLARGVLGETGAAPVRTGTGYDLHRLVEGRPLILGGVRVEHDRGALGHSDADVLCHAITDAILGGAGAGDIGQHFPDTDPAWKGADSLDLLTRAADVIRRRGFAIENVDAVVILERPKLSPYLRTMEARLAGALGVDAGCVSVKAKTNEGMDAVGRGEAVAAHAVALLRRSAAATPSGSASADH